MDAGGRERVIGVYVIVAVGLAYLAGYVHAHLEASLNERGRSTSTYRRENRRSRRYDEADKPRSLRVRRERNPW